MAIESLQALCTAMDQVALQTWRRLEDSRLPGRRFDETSITDSNLDAMRRRVPGLLIWQSSQSNERETGADWEWWIGDDNEGWLSLRMQAKRAYEDDTYAQLRHGGADGDSFQYDTLIRGCDADKGYYPFHVFYNGWPKGYFHPGTHWAVPAQWNACPNMRSYVECGHAEPRHYGCAIASSHDVKHLCDAQDPSRYSIVNLLSRAVPWSYAFGFPPPKMNQEHRWDSRIDRGNWLDRIHGTLVVLSERGGASGARDAAGHLHQIPLDRGKRTFDLPTYVQSMRRTAPGFFEPSTEGEVPAAQHTVIVERPPKRKRAPRR
ncbi:DUF6615 family protein [Streptomyces aculeolatus]|uniref:DUF6615 family protein n=1 Tax=Streptomyces aculeolatus TaxID=270689 RepID=UPI001CECFC4E|nr:DUF6615 family protein [Streptomyces aculeolatus]